MIRLATLSSALVATTALALAAGAEAAPASRPAARTAAASAAMPKRPDFSGVWENKSGIHFTNINGKPSPPPLNAEYAAKYQAVRDSARAGRPVNDPTANCVWPGVPRILLSPYPFEILVAPDRVTVIYEYMNTVRRIWMDGRKHPADYEPSYNGHAIGHWEADTLVVDTVGLRGDTMYENTGLPHSDRLHLVERIRLVGPDRLEDEITAIDPGSLTAPWVTKAYFQRHRDWEFFDYVCAENNRNPLSASGKTLTLGPDGKPIDKDAN